MARTGGGRRSSGLTPLLAEPAAVLLGNVGDQATGMFIALKLHQFELVKQTNLQLNHHDVTLEWFEDGELGVGISRLHQLFKQMVEMIDQTIAQAEFMLPGQALQQGNKPGDQIKTGLDDGQLSGTGLAWTGLAWFGLA